MIYKIGDKVIIDNKEYTVKYCSGYLWLSYKGHLTKRLDNKRGVGKWL